MDYSESQLVELVGRRRVKSTSAMSYLKAKENRRPTIVHVAAAFIISVVVFLVALYFEPDLIRCVWIAVGCFYLVLLVVFVWNELRYRKQAKLIDQELERTVY